MVTTESPRYRCACPECPGYPYKASEMAHPPDTCTEQGRLTARARAVLAGSATHVRAALGECAHGMWGMRRDLPPMLWRYRCNCGGLCDSGTPCPMGGDGFELTDIGAECYRLLTEDLTARARAVLADPSFTADERALLVSLVDLGPGAACCDCYSLRVRGLATIDRGFNEPTDLGREVRRVLAEESCDV